MLGKQTLGKVHVSGNARRGKMNIGRGVHTSGSMYLMSTRLCYPSVSVLNLHAGENIPYGSG